MEVRLLAFSCNSPLNSLWHSMQMYLGFCSRSLWMKAIVSQSGDMTLGTRLTIPDWLSLNPHLFAEILRIKIAQCEQQICKECCKQLQSLRMSLSFW